MNRPHTHKAGQKSRLGGLKWLGVAAGAAMLAYAALQIYTQYGAADTTRAETMVYGMLLFLGGTVLLAFLTVALIKLLRRLFRFGRMQFFLSRKR